MNLSLPNLPNTNQSTFAAHHNQQKTQPSFGQASPQKMPIETMSNEEKKAVRNLSDDYIDFLNASPCADFTNKTIIDRAQKAGFKPYPENGKVKPGDKYYVNNDYGSTALIVVGKKNPIQSGFNITASHTDGVQLELKPDPVFTKSGLARAKTLPWGGSTWKTWLQTPLAVAARVYGKKLGPDGKPALDPQTGLPSVESDHFVRIDRSIGMISDIAPHVMTLQEFQNQGGKINTETNLRPLVGHGRKDDSDSLKSEIDRSLREEHGIDPLRSRVFLYPKEPADYFGLKKDTTLIHGPAHDDRSMCYATMDALLDTAKAAEQNKNDIPHRTAVALFIHNEETGSNGKNSAQSPWIDTIFARLLRDSNLKKNYSDQQLRDAYAKSLIFSTDAAPAYDSAYPNASDKQNSGYLGYGPLLLSDMQGRVGTSKKGTAITLDLAEKAGVNVQVGTYRSDLMGGSTLGPHIAKMTQAETVDLGLPVISQHATQEVIDGTDLYLTKKLLTTLFKSGNS